MKEFDNLKENQGDDKNTWGGVRKGAGRVRHSKNKSTIEKEEAIRQFKDRVKKNTDKLFNAQLSLATGTQMLFVIHTDSKGVRRKPEMITDPNIISRFLDENEGVAGELESDKKKKDPKSKVEDYYFMTTVRPDNKAIDSLLNRVYGKPTEHIDHTTDGDKIEPVVIYRPEKLDANFET